MVEVHVTVGSRHGPHAWPAEDDGADAVLRELAAPVASDLDAREPVSHD